MIKKTITYCDFDGNEVTEDFYFNLTKAELIEFNYNSKGGAEQLLQKIVASNDTKQILEQFKILVSKAVGKRSEDGKRFIKTQEITDDFIYSEAYSEILMELLHDAAYAAEFTKGILPQYLNK